MLSGYAKVMKARLRPCHGMFLPYPASDLRMTYTPSRLNAFTDAILHPALLLLCLKEYLGVNQREAENDPLASPVFLSEAFVGGDPNDEGWPKKWPPTRIVVGELDPLLDDSLRLCHRMV
jgi:acetyl esterase/lipase